ncbi:MAG: septum formation protein Maf [Clostridia bacterium]|nr:septum formation protein Maf [Clostridia bacterium]
MRSCILASASPRRKEILKNLGVEFEVFVTDVDESSELTDPNALAEELAARKGRAAWNALHQERYDTAGKVLIASDTTVSVDGEILGKPADAEDAKRMLRMLQGRAHKVVSGIYLMLDGKEAVSHAVTEVEFAPMTEEQIGYYLNTGEPFGKAGAYAIQGIASAWIRGIKGDYFNVVGLPVNRMCELFCENFQENFL